MPFADKVGEIQLIEIDEPCRSLVIAMNRFPGIRTIESCCGHGTSPFKIWFVADHLTDLPALLYWFDRCHSGVTGWSVTVGTDCTMSPVTFLAQSSAVGEQAYVEADQIAAVMNDYLAQSKNSPTA